MARGASLSPPTPRAPTPQLPQDEYYSLVIMETGFKTLYLLSRSALRLQASLGGKRQTINESEMVLFSECSLQCARKVLDTADIVREAI